MLVGNTLLAGSAIGPAPFEVDTAEGDSKEGGPGGGAYLGCCRSEAAGRVRPGGEYTEATIGTEPWVRGGAPKLDNWEGRPLWKELGGPGSAHEYGCSGFTSSSVERWRSLRGSCTVNVSSPPMLGI